MFGKPFEDKKPKQKQLKCPSADGYIKKNVISVYNEYHSALIGKFWNMLLTWMKPEESHKRANTVWLHLCAIPRAVKFRDRKSNMMVTTGSE